MYVQRVVLKILSATGECLIFAKSGAEEITEKMIFSIDTNRAIEINNIVFDFNGTIALDGFLIDGIKEKIFELHYQGVNIYILTADTFGTVKEQCKDLPVKIEIINSENGTAEKKNIIETLGSSATAAIGNGRNDLEMFKSSILSIAVIGKEGCCTKAMFEADIVVCNIIDAIDILLKNKRLKATMRT